MKYYAIVATVLTKGISELAIIECGFHQDLQTVAFDFAVTVAEPYEDEFVGRTIGIEADKLRETFYMDYVTYEAIELTKDKFDILLAKGVKKLSVF